MLMESGINVLGSKLQNWMSEISRLALNRTSVMISFPLLLLLNLFFYCFQSAGTAADSEAGWCWRSNQGVFSQAVPCSIAPTWTAACGLDIFLLFFHRSLLPSTVDLNNKRLFSSSVFQSSSSSSGSPVQRRCGQPSYRHRPPPSAPLFH